MNLTLDSAHRRGPGFGAAALVALAFFIAIAPTLSWLEFSGGSENLVAAAALEMRRGGPVLVPNLQGAPRVAKPPLATWASAAGIRKSTMARLSNPDPAIRDPAFHEVGLELRWPALLAACLLLVATYALGRAIFDPTTGLVGACFCGCTLLFLRFSREATTDIHLALWVTATNACLALVLFHGRYWKGWIGAGIALGLAVMAKGPAAFLQTLVPFGVFLAIRPSLTSSATAEERKPDSWLPKLVAPLIGIAAMFLISLPWLLAILAKDPTAKGRLLKEITRSDATELKRDPWFLYSIFVYWIAPTIVWAVAGVIGTIQGLRFRQSTEICEKITRRCLLLILLVIVPIVVMSFFKDKKDRYLLPMTPAAALLAASAFVGWVRAGRPNGVGSVITRVIHWTLLLVFAIALPVMGATRFTEVDGSHWFTARQAAVFSMIGVAIWAAGMLYSIRNTWAAVAGTTLLMLFLQYPAMIGYRATDPGLSDLKPIADAIWRVAPDADVYEYDIPGRTRVRYDLPIYLNRITHKTSDPNSLEQSDHPIALVHFEGRAAEPTLGSEWKEIAEDMNSKLKWRVYLRPANFE